MSVFADNESRGSPEAPKVWERTRFLIFFYFFLGNKSRGSPEARRESEPDFALVAPARAGGWVGGCYI